MSNIKMVIGELHKAFDALNAYYFEGKLPEPAIVVQSKGNRKNILGWCSTQEIWLNDSTKDRRYEINLVAEYLHRAKEEVIETLLHEMVHLYNILNGIDDTSRNGRYHNKEFKATAEKCGLICNKNKQIGYTTHLNDEAVKVIEAMELADVFELHRLGMTTSSKKSIKYYVCPCCGLKMRATKKDVNILCGKCLEDILKNFVIVSRNTGEIEDVASMLQTTKMEIVEEDPEGDDDDAETEC